MKSPIAYLKEQRDYLSDNPNKLWFKRKLYGWGWTPATWQGWAVLGAWLMTILFFTLTLDKNSPPREVVFAFIAPIFFLTLLLIRICYKKGESPKWQWGREGKENSN